jgi:hypothetical protein
VQFDDNGKITGSSTPDFVSNELLADVYGSPPVDWGNIAAPRLGIFALYSLKAKLQWYSYLSAADQALFDEQFPAVVDWAKGTVRRFALGGGKVYLLPGQPHYIYINHETEVVREMRMFLGIVPPAVTGTSNRSEP